MTPRQIPSDLADAPTRAELVYLLLRELGPATKSDLVDATQRSASTIRRALRDLEERDLVGSERQRDDRRRRLYRVKSRD